MSRRIIGVTVGTPLPKPNWEQNNPKKGDYIKNKPEALNGKDGITPHIGDNGNWFIGDTDTGMPSRGEGGDSATGVWSGRKFAAFGTSVTWACQNHSGGYLKVIKVRNGFDSYLNAGVSGAAMANNTANGNGINHKIHNTDIAGYDLILIECSTNDFKLNVPLGEVGQMGDTEFNTDTFCGALRDSVEFLLRGNSKRHILLITDTHRNNAGYDVNYTNSAGHKLIDYVDAIIEIGALYGLPVCDWYRTSGFNALTLSTYTKDGLHPNDAGYTVLGNLTASAVWNMYCLFTASEEPGPDEDEDDIKIAIINGTAYDVSIASGYKYKMIMNNGGTLYMYYDTKPFKILPDGYRECFTSTCNRARDNYGKFEFEQALNDTSSYIALANGYYRLGPSRTLERYVWSNHDLLYWNTDEVAVYATEQ